MDLIGTVRKNNKGEEFKIIAKLPCRHGCMSRYKIKFTNTGTVHEAFRHNVLAGRVRDRYAVSIVGGGSLGAIKTTPDVLWAYYIWRDLMYRCYKDTNHNFKYYGGKGVAVCDRWKVFSNFYEDLPRVEGFNLKLIKEDKITLDKDCKQVGVKYKVYSLETCAFVTLREQGYYRENNEIAIIGTHKDGVIEWARSAREFARKHAIDPSSITKVLKGKLRQSKGWKFVYSDEVCNDYPERE
jgi:hypothetical protein